MNMKFVNSPKFKKVLKFENFQSLKFRNSIQTINHVGVATPNI